MGFRVLLRVPIKIYKGTIRLVGLGVLGLRYIRFGMRGLGFRSFEFGFMGLVHTTILELGSSSIMAHRTPPN